MDNTLKYEKSLYLVRHSTNPVPWQSWGENAFKMAKNLNRPVFLSIGYSSCHWCRVMEKESFEDTETAKILAEKFIPIKMDKDEFPDIDKEFQFYIQSTGDNGGWPLSVFLTPDKQPFFAGTYFPKDKSYGRPAFKDVLENIDKIYHNNYEEIEKVIKTRNDFLKSFIEIQPSTLPANTAKQYRVNEFIKIFDNTYYGFREGSKFPYVSSLNYLITHFDNKTVSDFLVNTSNKFATSCIFDHLFGGFFRYTVDRMWQVPHFEKMLADNAQIASFLTKMYEKTGNRLYLFTAQKTIDFILYGSFRTEYGFIDSLDADSQNNNGEHEEGFYYKVTDRDFSVLSEKELANFPNEAGVYNGVIFLKHAEYIKAAALEPSLQKVAKRIESVKVHPEADNKAISGHNFLLCTALLNLYEVTNEQYYFEQALALFHKLRHLVVYNNRVFRGIYAIENEINQYIINSKKENGSDEINLDKFIIKHHVLSDHVYYLENTLKFYELTQDKEFLNIAKGIASEIEDLFFNSDLMYLDTEHRIIDSFDDDKPNPVGLYMYLITKYSAELNKKLPEKLIEFAEDRAERFPTGHPTMLLALELQDK